MSIDLPLLFYRLITLYGLLGLALSAVCFNGISLVESHILLYALLSSACFLPVIFWPQIRSISFSLLRISNRCISSPPFYLPFLFPFTAIVSVSGYIIVPLLPGFSPSIVFDYFAWKGFAFGGIGWFRYLEDFSFLVLLSSCLRLSLKPIRLCRYLLLLQLPHVILLAHRGIILNEILFCIIIRNLHYLNPSQLLRSFANKRISRSLIALGLLFVLAVSLFLLPNLARENSKSLLEFLSLTVLGYFPFQSIFHDIAQADLDISYLVSPSDLLISFVAYPFLAFYKVMLPSPANAVNTALNGLPISEIIWKPIDVQGGVTPGIMAESIMLTPPYMSYAYLTLLPLAFSAALILLCALGFEVGTFAAALSVGFLFSPFNVLVTLVLLYLAFTALSVIHRMQALLG